MKKIYKNSIVLIMYISYTVLLTEGEKHEIEVGKISNIIKNKNRKTFPIFQSIFFRKITLLILNSIKMM